MNKALFFPQRVAEEPCFSWFLLGMRLLFGILLLTHGVAKLMNFNELSATFPDPLGIGSTFSLVLAILGEVVCPCAFILGILFRIALIPMIATMGVAFGCIHQGVMAEGELSLVYLLVFILMWIAGPGFFSLDKWLFGRSERPYHSRYLR